MDAHRGRVLKQFGDHDDDRAQGEAAGHGPAMWRGYFFLPRLFLSLAEGASVGIAVGASGSNGSSSNFSWSEYFEQSIPVLDQSLELSAADGVVD